MIDGIRLLSPFILQRISYLECQTYGRPIDKRMKYSVLPVATTAVRLLSKTQGSTFHCARHCFIRWAHQACISYVVSASPYDYPPLLPLSHTLRHHILELGRDCPIDEHIHSTPFICLSHSVRDIYSNLRDHQRLLSLPWLPLYRIDPIRRSRRSRMPETTRHIMTLISGIQTSKRLKALLIVKTCSVMRNMQRSSTRHWSGGTSSLLTRSSPRH
jgi:hypothetical protein